MPRAAIKGPRKMTSPAGKYGEADSPEIVTHGDGGGGTGSKSVKTPGGSTGNRDKNAKAKLGRK